MQNPREIDESPPEYVIPGIILPETADIETSSQAYARRFLGPVGEWFLQVQSEATRRMLSPYPKSRVLDVGGGHGQLTGLLAGNGHKTTVMGSSEECKARLLPWLNSGEVEFTVGNFLDMPFRDRQFDVVISYRLIAHIANTQQFIKELTRVADKAVILDYPEVRSINYLEPHLFQVKKAIEETVRRYNCFRQADLDEQFHQLGFEPSSRYPQYFLPMALHRKTNNVRLSSALERIFRFVCLTSTFGSPVIYKAVRKEFVTSDQAASQSFRPEPRRSHSR